MELQSLKIGKKRTKVTWLEQQGEKGQEVDREIHLSGKQAPHPDLVDAMKALKQPVLALLKLTPKWGEDFEITGISISEQKGGRGLIVMGQKPIPGTGRPFNVITPLLVEAPDDGEDGTEDDEDEVTQLFELVETVQSEAGQYVEGKRAQLELLDEAEEKANAAVGA